MKADYVEALVSMQVVFVDIKSDLINYRYIYKDLFNTTYIRERKKYINPQMNREFAIILLNMGYLSTILFYLYRRIYSWIFEDIILGIRQNTNIKRVFFKNKDNKIGLMNLRLSII